MRIGHSSSASDKLEVEKADIANLKALRSYLAPHKLYIFGAVFALLITSGSVLGIGKGLGYLIDNGLHGGNSSMLNHALITLLAITMLLAIGTFARYYLVTITGEKVVAHIRRDIYNHIISLSPEFFEKTKTGELLSRITTDTTLLQVVIGSSVSVALRNVILLIGALSLLVISSPKLAIIVLFMVPVVIVPIIFLGKKLRKLSRISQEKVAKLSSHVEETLYGIKTVQAFAREKLEKKHFANHVNESLDAAQKRTFLRAILTAIVILFVFSSIGFVLWVGGKSVMDGDMTAGTLSSFIFYAIVVAGATGAISEVVGDLQRAAGAAERLMELLSTKTKVPESKNPQNLPDIVKGEIEFKDVTFSYPSLKNSPSLKDINLKVYSGQNVALVGPSGAGKTTIFEILLRFYDIDKGSISIDGIPINNLRFSNLRDLFALVPQDPVIFSGTAYENILFGRPDATEEQIFEAAKAAAAYDFISNLPKGFSTYLGEKGVRLSGGQKQRIAIARAFLKDPKILLLDEATSALDAESEKLIQEAFERLMKNRTTLVIAHRLATIQKADKIIVLDEGKICEEGNHKDLIKKKGLYSRLAKLQFE
ncbi:ABC transporter transmembrane domain-containing protein [Rickettsiales bacterium]|nr:ABC transporter transmembrane domain-containing protein [Rickettsiales bacterium]